MEVIFKNDFFGGKYGRFRKTLTGKVTQVPDYLRDKLPKTAKIVSPLPSDRAVSASENDHEVHSAQAEGDEVKAQDLLRANAEEEDRVRTEAEVTRQANDDARAAAREAQADAEKAEAAERKPRRGKK